jgi:hypothetical protein
MMARARSENGIHLPRSAESINPSQGGGKGLSLAKRLKAEVLTYEN